MKQEKKFLSRLLKKAVTDGEIIKINVEKTASVLINISDAIKHSVEQQAMLRMESRIDYTNSLDDMKFLMKLFFNGLKK